MISVNAMSLWEPWATAMRMGLKENETRSWKPLSRDVGKLLLICASKTKKGIGECPEAAEIVQGADGFEGFHFGKAVCLVKLVGSKKTEEIGPIGPMEYELGDYSFGRYAWETEMVNNTFEVFDVRGQQGVFKTMIEDRMLDEF